MKGTNWHVQQWSERTNEHIAELHREAQTRRELNLAARGKRRAFVPAALSLVARAWRRFGVTFARPRRARPRV